MDAIFLAKPSYDGRVDERANLVVGSELSRPIKVIDARGSSAICHSFNSLWCKCLNSRDEFGVTHFMMLHADVRPQEGFAKIMLDEMKRTGADILSAVIPLKDQSGNTSTALARKGKDHRRLTLREIATLPATFGLEDVKVIDPNTKELLVNDGLMLVNLDFKEVRRLFFRTMDGIEERNGKLVPFFFPEDWFFSMRAARLGAKVLATTKVIVEHVGMFAYSNRGIWGDEHDTMNM